MTPDSKKNKDKVVPRKFNKNRVYEDKYKPEFCELLIKHFEEGGAFNSFPAVCGVVRSTLYEWVNRYPEFKEAKSIGEAKYQKLMETILIAKSLGRDGKNFDVKKSDITAVIFALKTRCHKDYSQKDKMELSGHLAATNVDGLSDDQIKERIKILKLSHGADEE